MMINKLSSISCVVGVFTKFVSAKYKMNVLSAEPSVFMALNNAHAQENSQQDMYDHVKWCNIQVMISTHGMMR